MIGVNTSTIAGSCGVGNVFDYTICPEGTYYRSDLEKIQTEGGCGWIFASFIENDDVCQGVYKVMQRKWKLMYQSPVKLNINSGNKFFFCIFEIPEDEPRGFNYETEAEYLERGDDDNEEESW